MLKIGKVLKPQGIHGELKMLCLTDPKAINGVKEINIGTSSAKVQSIRFNKNFAFVKVDISKSIEDAEKFRNEPVYADRAGLNLGQCFVYDDLIGCEIYFSDGERVGEIVDIDNFGSADIFTVQNGLKRITCPFVEKVFSNIDVANKRITADKKAFKEVALYEN